MNDATKKCRKISPRLDRLQLFHNECLVEHSVLWERSSRRRQRGDRLGESKGEAGCALLARLDAGATDAQPANSRRSRLGTMLPLTAEA